MECVIYCWVIVVSLFRYLNSNQISGLSADASNTLFNNLPSLQNMWALHCITPCRYIYWYISSTLSANSWHCDCNLTQLQAVLLSSSSKVADGSAMVCQSPSDLSNSLITDLNFYSNPLCFTSKRRWLRGVCVCVLMLLYLLLEIFILIMWIWLLY